MGIFTDPYSYAVDIQFCWIPLLRGRCRRVIRLIDSFIYWLIVVTIILKIVLKVTQLKNCMSAGTRQVHFNRSSEDTVQLSVIVENLGFIVKKLV